MNNTPKELYNVILASRVIAVSGHISPDGDALGAACAMTLALRKMGKEVHWLSEPFAEKYRQLPAIDTVSMEPLIACDLFIAVDCAALDRLEAALPLYQQSAVKMNIDHHHSNNGFGDYNYVFGDASSTSELVYQLLEAWGIPLDKDIAEALYIGMIHDTGGFRHSSTKSSTMEIAGRLMALGIPFTEIQQKQLYAQSFPCLQLSGLALSRAQLELDGRLIYTYITTREVQVYHGDVKELDQVVGTLKSVENTDVAVFFYEKRDGTVKASFRSEGKINVSSLAMQFGGGGHLRAAGCTFSDTMEIAIKKVLAAAKAALEE